jgi:lysozyme family protein
MKDNLSRCLDLIGVSEAGYSDHPDDPGGPTNHGITQRTLAAWRKQPVMADDVKALTVAEARDILASQYATPIRFDDLPSGLDYCVLDCAVNSGPDRAGRLLQQTLGMTGQDVDGIIGLHTIAALKADATSHVSELISDYCSTRLNFMQSLSNWSTFGKGWTRRVQGVEADATKMAAGMTPASPAMPVLPVPAEDAGQAKATGPVKITATKSGKAALFNIASTVAAVAVTAGTAASQVSGALQPYADISFVRYALLGLTVISAAGTLAVALQRAHSGATS